MSKLGTLGRNWGFFPIANKSRIRNLIDSTAFESHASAWLNHLRSSVVKIKFSVTCLFDLNGQPFNKKLNIFNLNDFPPPLTNMSQISWACCSGMRINLNFLIGFSN